MSILINDTINNSSQEQRSSGLPLIVQVSENLYHCTCVNALRIKHEFLIQNNPTRKTAGCDKNYVSK